MCLVVYIQFDIVQKVTFEHFIKGGLQGGFEGLKRGGLKGGLKRG